jgi:hypothetical protein
VGVRFTPEGAIADPKAKRLLRFFCFIFQTAVAPSALPNTHWPNFTFCIRNKRRKNRRNKKNDFERVRFLFIQNYYYNF